MSNWLEERATSLVMVGPSMVARFEGRGEEWKSEERMDER